MDLAALAVAHRERARAEGWGEDGLPNLDVAPAPKTNAPGQQSAQGGQSTGKPYVIAPGGIAIVRVSGPTTKYTTSFQDAIGGTSTLVIRRTLQLAARDPDVRGALLHVEDCPGGTLAGTFELADAIKAFSAIKPIRTHVDDWCCSAGVAFATATQRITSNLTGHVGSVGVLAELRDYSAKYAKEGVKVIPIGSGKFKGAGMQGVPISEDVIADQQEKINALNEMFTARVATGRNLDPKKIKAWQARVFLAQDAKGEGLIDDVASFEDAVGAFASDLDKPTKTQTGNGGAPGTTKIAAKGIPMNPQLLAILGLAATATEADVVLSATKMKNDLDAANARLKDVPRVPDADALADRADALGDRVDALAEAGTLKQPVADAIKSAVGLSTEDGKKSAPVAAMLTPVASLGNKTVGAWALDLFKIDAESVDAPEGGAKSGDQGGKAAKASSGKPAGAKVQKRNVPGEGDDATARANGSADDNAPLTPEREAELLGMSSLGTEVLANRNGNGRK